MTGGKVEELTKFFYSISEVSGITGVKPHVLRYWESEFKLLRPKKGRAGRRRYTPEDIKLVLLIKKLLHQDRFTLEGAKKRLRQLKQGERATPPPPGGRADRALLSEIRRELAQIADILK